MTARRPRPTLFAALALTAILLLSACAQPLGNYFAETAAVVNNQKIPYELVSRRLRELSTLQEGIFDGKDWLTARKEVERSILLELIRQTLIEQEAKRSGITIGDAEVQAQIAELKRQAGPAFSDDDLVQELNKQGLSVAYLEELIRVRSFTRLVFEELTADIEISDDNVLHVAHILICEGFSRSRPCEITEKDRQTAAGVRDRARNGADFAALAKEFSADPSAERNGGDLGWILEGGLVEEFETVAFGLQAGQVSDVVETQFGLHVIKVIARGPAPEDALPALTNALTQRRNDVFTRWLQEALDGATIKVNPKIGRFDRDTFAVVPIASPVPKEELRPEPPELNISPVP